MEKIKLMITGEIVMSDKPGEVMRKWREIFNISQSELASYLGISPSTISDYEGDRRNNPGIRVVQRFVNALFEIDAKRGSPVAKRIMLSEQEKDYYEAREFTKALTVKEFASLIDGEILTNKEIADEIKIYGYTLIDSLKVILEMPYEEFPKLYGAIGARAFIFIGVSTGRSPLVVIRVAPVKPKAVVLVGLKKVDELALKISERERIPIITTQLDVNEIKERLGKI